LLCIAGAARRRTCKIAHLAGICSRLGSLLLVHANTSAARVSPASAQPPQPVQLANGFFGTFISLRVAINLGLRRPGLVLSAYFAGFTFGALAAGSSNGSVTFARTPRFAGMVLLPFPVCAHSIGFGYS